MARIRRNPRASKVIESEIIEIFGAETVPLDDEMINHLVAAHGWNRVQLEEAKKLGFQYCPKRDSLMDGPGFNFWGDGL